MNFGFPHGTSPFVQVRLPTGFKFESKASRAVCFAPESVPVPRGTSRTKAAAEQAASAWSWRWFAELPAATQRIVSSNSDAQPQKRRRMD